MTPTQTPAFRPSPHQARLPDRPAQRRLPDSQLIRLAEKVAALERWKAATESDLKEIRDVISQVKLLMSLSIGGGGLSIISLIVTIAALGRG